MTDEIIYPYTQRNLLEKPEYYMYSAYHGVVFIPEYLRQRFSCANDFEYRYLQALNASNNPMPLWLNAWSGILLQNPPLFSMDVRMMHSRLLETGTDLRIETPSSFEELESSSIIQTQLWLRRLLKCAFEQDAVHRQKYSLWLDRFVRRYEITKRLYSTYQLPMKAVSDEYTVGLNYALLSLTLIYEFKWTQNLKSLNSALKLNDLLCSTTGLVEDPETLLEALLSVRTEATYIREIADSKMVKI